MGGNGLDSGGWTRVGGQGVGGQRWVDSGRWTGVGGQELVDSGGWTAVGGQGVGTDAMTQLTATPLARR